MTKEEMLEILRGKVLTESPEEIQARLNEIADELEQSERVVRCRDCIYFENWVESLGVCRNARCMKKPNGFCDEGLRKEQRDEQNRND